MARLSGCRSARPICARSEPSKPGSRPRRSAMGRCFAGCGVCRRRGSARGAKRKPVADHYRIGTNPIDTDSIALVVKKWTGLAGLDGCRLCRAQFAAGCNLERRRPRCPHRPAQAVFRPRLAQKPRGICRARRIAPQPSAQGRPLTKLEAQVIRLASGNGVGELTAVRDVIRPQYDLVFNRQSRRCAQCLVDDAEPLAGLH